MMSQRLSDTVILSMQLPGWHVLRAQHLRCFCATVHHGRQQIPPQLVAVHAHEQVAQVPMLLRGGAASAIVLMLLLRACA